MSVRETKWLCENSRVLEKFSGQWVMFCAMDGVLCSGESLKTVLDEAKKRKHPHKPYVFLVPSKSQLEPPIFHGS